MNEVKNGSQDSLFMDIDNQSIRVSLRRKRKFPARGTQISCAGNGSSLCGKLHGSKGAMVLNPAERYKDTVKETF